MKKFIKEHLETITVDKMFEYKKDVFISYASANGIDLGFDAYGQFVVKGKGKTHKFNNPAIAIEKYSEMVRDS